MRLVKMMNDNFGITYVEPKGYSVHLLDTLTGKRSVYEQPDYYWHHVNHDKRYGDSAGTAQYIWEEGNYSCDCNRLAFMYDEDEANPFTCNGSENQRVTVEKIVLSDGTEVYSE
jgi:hypothetical protein